MLPYLAAFDVDRYRLVEILPPPEIEPVGRVEHQPGRRSADRVAFHESQERRIVDEFAAFGRVERHGLSAVLAIHGHAGEILVSGAEVRHFEPQNSAIGRPHDAAGAEHVTRTMPGAEIEVAGVAGAEVVPVDDERSAHICRNRLTFVAEFCRSPAAVTWNFKVPRGAGVAGAVSGTGGLPNLGFGDQQLLGDDLIPHRNGCNNEKVSKD